MFEANFITFTTSLTMKNTIVCFELLQINEWLRNGQTLSVIFSDISHHFLLWA